MEASLVLILISPRIFIMAPQVTPARCMKCPTSCHPCPLPLYLCNLFLLPPFPPSFSSILSLPLTSTYLDPLGDTSASSAHINVMYCWSQDATVFFFPSSESIMFIVSAFQLVSPAIGFPLCLADKLSHCVFYF